MQVPVTNLNQSNQAQQGKELFLGQSTGNCFIDHTPQFTKDGPINSAGQQDGEQSGCVQEPTTIIRGGLHVYVHTHIIMYIHIGHLHVHVHVVSKL